MDQMDFNQNFMSSLHTFGPQVLKEIWVGEKTGVVSKVGTVFVIRPPLDLT